MLSNHGVCVGDETIKRLVHDDLQIAVTGLVSRGEPANQTDHMTARLNCAAP